MSRLARASRVARWAAEVSKALGAASGGLAVLVFAGVITGYLSVVLTAALTAAGAVVGAYVAPRGVSRSDVNTR